MKLRMAVVAVALGLSLGLLGCIPEHDYTGDHEMTWTALFAYTSTPPHSVAKGGFADVRIRRGPGDELLVDLGPGLCRLSALYVAADNPKDWPYFSLAPQRCTMGDGDSALELSVGGTGTYDDGDETRLTMVLTGSFTAGAQRGSVTWQFTSAY